MSKSPWHDVDDAFGPMFEDDVAVATRDGKRQTLKVALFQCGTGEALTDGAIEADRGEIQAVCRREDVAFVKGLRRGDSLTDVRTGRKYGVVSVDDDFAMGLVVYAREA